MLMAGMAIVYEGAGPVGHFFSRRSSMSRRYVSLAVCLALGVATVGAQNNEKDQNKEQERLGTAALVMDEVLNVPDNVPQEVLDKAECVIVIPAMTKVALGIGGSYGRGAMVCRSG
jgi:lipid-binding SYLF domain-containing protein